MAFSKEVMEKRLLSIFTVVAVVSVARFVDRVRLRSKKFCTTKRYLLRVGLPETYVAEPVCNPGQYPKKYNRLRLADYR